MQPSNILEFWFEEISPEKWFLKDDSFDQDIRDRFLPTYLKSTKGEFDSWADTAEGYLALVILLDQFSRNLYRGQPEAFAQDQKALDLSEQAIQKGFDLQLPTVKRMFLYMPYMHSEDLSTQEKGVKLFKELDEPVPLEYMIQHRDIIARFGRFPHRNVVMGRESSAEEIEFLKQPGSSF